jgi:isocitrate dehydrogenase
LRKRAQLDNLPELEAFADKIEKASIETIEEGTITGDLNNLLENDNKKTVTTEEFLKAVAAKL